MRKHSRFHWLQITLLAIAFLRIDAVRLQGQEKTPPEPTTNLAAQRLWALTDLVLKTHVDPPARQQMLLGGIKGLFQAAKILPPTGISEKISGLSTEKEWTALLHSLWTESKEVQKLSQKDWETATLHGLLQTVPGNPYVISAQARKVQEQLANNRYVGIGVMIQYDAAKKMTQIITPFRAGPADEGGMKPGDYVLAVDGKDVTKLTLAQTVDRLRGEKGTDLTVTVRQPNSKETRTLKMTRRVVPMESVVGYRHGPKNTWDYSVDPAAPIAYVWLKSFSSSTLHELRKIEQQLKAQNVRALVLDLRSTRPGLLHHATLVADGLLNGGTMWQVRSREGAVRPYRANEESLFQDWPIAVVVGKTTYGMDTLLLAAALKDNNRAVIVGDPMESDGVVKEIVELKGYQGGLVIPTGSLERADGTSAAKLQPDHEIGLSGPQQARLAQWQRAKDFPELPEALKNQDLEDPQLAKAIEVLKGALKITNEATPRK